MPGLKKGGKNPFTDNAEDDASADDRAIARTRSAIAGSDDEDTEIEIGGDDDDDGDGDDADDTEPAPQARGTRSDRRRARGLDRSAIEEANKRAERAEAATRLLIERWQPPQPQPQPQQKPAEPDALDSEYDGLIAQQSNLQNKLNAAYERKASQTEIDAIQKEGFDLRKKFSSNEYRRNLRDHGGGQQSGMTPRQVEAQVAQARMRDEHGDVLGRKDAALYFQGAFQQLMATGKPDDWNTIAEAAEAARKHFRMPSKVKRPAPTPQQQQRLAAVPRGAGPRAEEPAQRRTIKMTKENKRMADEAFPHIKDQAKRHQKWANEVGPKLLDD